MMSYTRTISGSSIVLLAGMALFTLSDAVEPTRVDPGDERYDMCCRLKHVPEEYLPLCNYTKHINAWEEGLEVLRAHPNITTAEEWKAAGIDPSEVLSKETQDILTKLDVFEKDGKENHTLSAILERCGRPKSMRGMGRCCARKGLQDCRHEICVGTLDLAGDNSERRMRLLECTKDGPANAMESMITGFKCLREISE
jgi:hypothetical protein